jgi:membrane associated rhomboid family serine protease
MFKYNSSGFFSSIPPVVKNIIFINALMLLAMFINETFMIEKFALFYPASSFFRPHQFITHIFMHGSFLHLFFNMWMFCIFGATLEHVWGGKKFLLYYLVTGIGAAAFHTGVNWLESLSFDRIEYHVLLMTPTVGASGAVFGVLLAFGMLFPNNVIQMLFPPIAVKAKWFVVICGVFELVLGVSQTGSHIAHFAHIGGMIFGFILVKYWQRKGRMYF